MPSVNGGNPGGKTLTYADSVIGRIDEVRPGRKRKKEVRWSQAIADELVARHAGGECLHQICKDEHMPHESSVRMWYVQDKHGFAEPWAAARQAYFDRMADEILEIADDGSNDWIERETKAGRMGRQINRELVQRSALRVNTRLWILTRALPQLYSLRGPNALPPRDPTGIAGQFSSSHDQDLLQAIRDLKLPKVKASGFTTGPGHIDTEMKPIERLPPSGRVKPE